MKADTHIRASLLLLAALASFGCKRNIVKAAPAPVAPPLASQPLPAPQPNTAVATAQPEPPSVPDPQPQPTVACQLVWLRIPASEHRRSG